MRLFAARRGLGGGSAGQAKLPPLVMPKALEQRWRRYRIIRGAEKSAPAHRIQHSDAYFYYTQQLTAGRLIERKEQTVHLKMHLKKNAKSSWIWQEGFAFRTNDWHGTSRQAETAAPPILSNKDMTWYSIQTLVLAKLT
jgi:hypothetical protein